MLVQQLNRKPFVNRQENNPAPPLFQRSIHTAPEEFENVALFLRSGLPSTQIRHENKAFRKRSSNWKNLKTSVLRFSVNGKHFENES